MITIKLARELIIELNLPESILALYDGNYADNVLQNDFQAPYAILRLNKQQQALYLTQRYQPILAYAFEKIFAYDIEAKKYITYNIEYFREDKLTPMSWDCLFVDIVIMWWELEYVDAKIVELGKTLGIQNGEYILKLIKAGHKKAYIIETLSTE